MSRLIILSYMNHVRKSYVLTENKRPYFEECNVVRHDAEKNGKN